MFNNWIKLFVVGISHDLFIYFQLSVRAGEPRESRNHSLMKHVESQDAEARIWPQLSVYRISSTYHINDLTTALLHRGKNLFFPDLNYWLSITLLPSPI